MISIFVVALLMLTAVPLVSAATAITLSTAVGPVGTEIYASGTVSTFNGRYQIVMYADGVTPTLLEEGTATGYSYTSDVFEIPNAYAGGRTIQVIDLDTAGAPTSNAIFTVQTKLVLKSTPTSSYEGGPITLLATVTGADAAWDGIFDLRIRVKNPSSTVVLTSVGADLSESDVGYYTYSYSTADPDAALVDYGTYTALLDWDDDAGWTESARQGVASATFIIRLTDQAEYQRTQTVKMQTYVPSGKTLSKFQITYPNGDTTVVDVLPAVVGPAWTGEVEVIETQKDAALGTWTVKLYDSVAAAYYKTATFTVKIAEFTAVIMDFNDPTELERTLKAMMEFRFSYPNGDYLAAADTKAGLGIKVYYNTTLAATVVLDPLLAFDVPSNVWSAEWKVPKDAMLGTHYAMNITANSVEDVYGNKGPAEYISSGEEYSYFKVIPAVLSVTTPSLTYPAGGATVTRMPVTPPKATFQVKYPDGSLMTGSDMSQLNVTVTRDLITLYTLRLAAADYNAAVGLWVATWKVPYNVPENTGFQFWVLAEDVKDVYDNGKNVATVASSAFGVQKAVITVSMLETDAASYESDSNIKVSFKATYPNGETVTKASPWVYIYEGATEVADKKAAYNAASELYEVTFIIPGGQPSGKWNATIFANDVFDDAPTPANVGPNAKMFVNFEVDRISLADVLAAVTASSASSTEAGVKADAAATAATAAGTAASAAATAATAAGAKADAAATAATAAGTAATAAGAKADAAATAANAAKASADAAKAAADAAGTKTDSIVGKIDGLQTLVYGAIGASLIAAIAAIVALMQISRKIA